MRHMNNRDRQYLDWWGKTRAKGKWRYVATTGFIWGLFSGILSKLFEMIVDGKGFAETFLTNDFLLYIVVFIVIGGFLFGLSMWYMSERKYRKLQESLSTFPPGA